MKTGLVLVDIQNDYFPGGSMALTGMQEASRNAASLLARFRENGWPTFHVQHMAASETATFFCPVPAVLSCMPISNRYPVRK